MRRVGVVTDSTACIPRELAGRLGIQVIPLFLAFEDQTYQDGMTAQAAEFYRTLASARRPPTTAAPSPGAYAEAILRAGAGLEAVLCITVARQFSAMYDAAVQGAALVRERAPGLDVRVLDSRAAAMAQGFVALEAARAAQAGAGIEQIAACAEALMGRVRLLVALGTLTYLARSGRVPRLLVWASSPLQVKPVVEFHQGSYRRVALARTMPRAVERLFQLLVERAGSGGLHVCVHHTNAVAEAEALAERIRAAFQPAELFIEEFTQVMGVHTGPGLLGFAFYTEA
jgi:DegV family protein with EDD domain